MQDQVVNINDATINVHRHSANVYSCIATYVGRRSKASRKRWAASMCSYPGSQRGPWKIPQGSPRVP